MLSGHTYLEYLPGGSIKSLINRIGPFSEQHAKIYIKQMLDGMQYLHKNKIVHRDLKGANLLLDADGVVRVSDFGSSKQYGDKIESGFLKTIRGSIAWTAPEVVKQIGHGRKADIWSIGCTVYEMLTGSPPWVELDYIQMLVKLAKTSEVPQLPEDLSSEAKEFLSLCLQRDPTSRPTVSQLLATNFITTI